MTQTGDVEKPIWSPSITLHNCRAEVFYQHRHWRVTSGRAVKATIISLPNMVLQGDKLKICWLQQRMLSNPSGILRRALQKDAIAWTSKRWPNSTAIRNKRRFLRVVFSLKYPINNMRNSSCLRITGFLHFEKARQIRKLDSNNIKQAGKPLLYSGALALQDGTSILHKVIN